MHTSVFMIQASTPHTKQSPPPKPLCVFVYLFIYFLENALISDRISHLATLITSPAQCSLPPSWLTPEKARRRQEKERRPLKCQTILPAPFSVPSAGLPCRLFLTGGIGLCIPSLIHVGGGRKGERYDPPAALIPLHSHLSMVKSMTTPQLNPDNGGQRGRGRWCEEA